ncbi:MAG: hypothetical protein QOG87_1375 [Actinomycetota bacterium]
MIGVRSAAAAVLLAVALTACAGGSYSVPEPKPLPKLPDTTAVQDFSGVVLAGVPGRTTTTAAQIGPGQAGLSGTVAGPEGQLGGAVVHLERIVDGGTAVLDILTKPDGTWQAPNILGGRYRIRAFLAPELALVKPSVFFLGGTEKKTLAITLQRYTGLVATTSIAPSPPFVDEPASLVVRIATQSVDGGGVVRSVGSSGLAAQLVGTGQWRVESPNPTITDESGNAYWQVRCRAAGEQPLAVLVNDVDTLTVNLPACQDFTVVAPPPDDGTTTSFPFRRSTTTSTTRRTTTTLR